MIAVPQTPLDRWLPKLVLCLRQYNLRYFTGDGRRDFRGGRSLATITRQERRGV
jgi:hypothetical protein